MKAISILFFLSMLVCGCTKSNITVNNLNNGHVYVIGHGGSGIPDVNNPYPFNSWDGVVYAVEHDNAEGVETDVQLSADSIIFMYHDETLESSSYCSGCLNNYTGGALTQCVLKQSTINATTFYLTPFENLLARFSQRNIKPFIFMDIHTSTECMGTDMEINRYIYRLFTEINRLEAKYNAYDWLNVQSINRVWLKQAHHRFPRMRLLLDDVTSADDVAFATEIGLYGIAAKNSDVTKDITALAHAGKLNVQLYGANAQSDIIDALGKSPDYFLSDNILLLENILQ